MEVKKIGLEDSLSYRYDKEANMVIMAFDLESVKVSDKGNEIPVNVFWQPLEIPELAKQNKQLKINLIGVIQELEKTEKPVKQLIM